MRNAQILTIYEESVTHIWLFNWSLLNFLIYEENFIFLLINAPSPPLTLPTLFPSLFQSSSSKYDFALVSRLLRDSNIYCNWWESEITLCKINGTNFRRQNLKMPKVREFRILVFFVNKSYLGGRLRDWNFFCLFWRLRLIFNILYFLRMLSVR